MQIWKITSIDSTTAVRHGLAEDVAQAWGQAAGAVMDGLAAGEFDRCAIIIADTPSALLLAGRTEQGALDLPDARTAVQRMAVAASGWPFSERTAARRELGGQGQLRPPRQEAGCSG